MDATDYPGLCAPIAERLRLLNFYCVNTRACAGSAILYYYAAVAAAQELKHAQDVGLTIQMIDATRDAVLKMEASGLTATTRARITAAAEERACTAGAASGSQTGNQ